MFNNETRVKGEANIGDRVRYWDMSNQDGDIFEILSAPYDVMTEAIGGNQRTYKLYNQNVGFRCSDLRQHGWSFVERV